MPKNKGKVSYNFFSFFFSSCDKESPRLAYPNFSSPCFAMVSTPAEMPVTEVDYVARTAKDSGWGDFGGGAFFIQNKSIC